MESKKAKCYFCPFVGAVRHFRKMFNGRPVCVCCAAKRVMRRTLPEFHGLPEAFTREEALRKLAEVQQIPGLRIVRSRAKFADLGGLQTLKEALRRAVA